jgi:uncharacterized OB-fold protein
MRSYSELLCPVCGYNYMHQGEVWVCTREREDGPTKTIKITHDGQAVAAVGVPNPSSRRQGMYIGFHCEACHDGTFAEHPPYLLAIVQHKGNTTIYWHLPDGNKAIELQE